MLDWRTRPLRSTSCSHALQLGLREHCRCLRIHHGRARVRQAIQAKGREKRNASKATSSKRSIKHSTDFAQAASVHQLQQQLQRHAASALDGAVLAAVLRRLARLAANAQPKDPLVSSITAQLAERLAPHIKRCSSRDLVWCLWALVKLRRATNVTHICQAICRGLGESCAMAQLSAAALTALVYALTKLAEMHEATKLLPAALEACTHQADRMDMQELATVTGALADLHHYDSQLMAAAAQAAAQKLAPKVRPSDLSRLLWAFAHLNHYSAPLTEAALAVVPRLARQLDARSIPTLAWAVAVLCWPCCEYEAAGSSDSNVQAAHAAFERLLAAAAARGPEAFTAQGLWQLHHARMLLLAAATHGGRAAPTTSDPATVVRTITASSAGSSAAARQQGSASDSAAGDAAAEGPHRIKSWADSVDEDGGGNFGAIPENGGPRGSRRRRNRRRRRAHEAAAGGDAGLADAIAGAAAQRATVVKGGAAAAGEAGALARGIRSSGRAASAAHAAGAHAGSAAAAILKGTAAASAEGRYVRPAAPSLGASCTSSPAAVALDAAGASGAGEQSLGQQACAAVAATTAAAATAAQDAAVSVLLGAAEEAWIQSQGRKTTSHLQEQVYKELLAMRLSPLLEHPTTAGDAAAGTVDIALLGWSSAQLQQALAVFTNDSTTTGKCGVGGSSGDAAAQGSNGVVHDEGTAGGAAGQPPPIAIAIEVDGPTHFASAASQPDPRPLGSTVARDWFLRQRGWRVVSVRWMDWDRAESAAGSGRHALLAAALLCGLHDAVDASKQPTAVPTRRQRERLAKPEKAEAAEWQAQSRRSQLVTQLDSCMASGTDAAQQLSLSKAPAAAPASLANAAHQLPGSSDSWLDPRSGTEHKSLRKQHERLTQLHGIFVQIVGEAPDDSKLEELALSGVQACEGQAELLRRALRYGWAAVDEHVGEGVLGGNEAKLERPNKARKHVQREALFGGDEAKLKRLDKARKAVEHAAAAMSNRLLRPAGRRQAG